VLQGGLPAWEAEGLSVHGECDKLDTETAPVERWTQRKEMQWSLVEIMQNQKTQAAQVVDARSAARFKGEVQETRPGCRSGHMPFSINLPHSNVLDGTKLKEGEALTAALSEVEGISKPIVYSCGSGLTAATVALAHHILDPERSFSIYDGSWAEYGTLQDTPVLNDPEQV